MGWQGTLTHRQFLCWQVWFNEEIENPSRDNLYQMQIACEIRRSYVKKPSSVNINDFRIKLDKENKEDNIPDEIKKRSDDLKKIFIGYMTAPVTVERDGVTVDTIVPPLVRRKQLIEEQERKAQDARSKMAERKVEQNERRTHSRNSRKG